MRICLLLIFSSLVLTFSGCSDNTVQTRGKANFLPESVKQPMRVGMVTGIKPDKIEYYKQLHANAWPGVLKKINECNIRNYSIYIKQIQDKYYLFSYYEYIGDNYQEDMNKIAADSITQRWWKETDPCQSPLPDAAAKGQIWSPMEEVFYAN